MSEFKFLRKDNGNFTAEDNKIKSVGTPVDGLDAVNKDYCDANSGSVGDNDFNYNESNTESSTTSTGYQEKVKLTFTPISEGDYEIDFSFICSHSDTGVFFKNRIQIDDSITKHQWFTEFYNFKYEDGAWQGRSGKAIVHLSATQHTIDLDFCSGISGVTAYIKESLITARRIA